MRERERRLDDKERRLIRDENKLITRLAELEKREDTMGVKFANDRARMDEPLRHLTPAIKFNPDDLATGDTV